MKHSKDPLLEMVVSVIGLVITVFVVYIVPIGFLIGWENMW